MPSRIVVKSAEFKTLNQLNAAIIDCDRCLRLRSYCAEIGRVRRRAHADFEYWARPVPSFGDPEASVWVLGLAPAAHGSNRTGRPFTGDGPRSVLYPTLYKTGFASQPDSIDRYDGMKLTGLWVSAVGRCAPPVNKPTPEELRNCSPWLDAELRLLKNCSVVVALGKIAFDAFLSAVLRAKIIPAKSGFKFAHGAEYKLPNGQHLLASYHPSLQNTNTGRLTLPMFENIFIRAREVAGEGQRD
jgi:uracil-DNA glycosylase family 4